MSPSRLLVAPLRRVAIAVPIVTMLFAGIASLTPASAASATGTVNTSGIDLNVRSSASTSASVVGSVADGAKITIDCQTYGTNVSGTYGTSDIWDHIPARGGYVSDTYVYTGSDTMVAPLCGGTTTKTCKNSFSNPNSCAQAVSWAKSHETTAYHSDYAGRCDHVVALAYGWSASGSTTARAHWLAIPAADKYPGDSNVPAGGLAFFSGGSSGAGHVMISIGGGNFVSTDIHGSGTFGVTTIATIKSQWGETYSGWAQPWFQINH
jgi:uncharacterized protein YraI